MNFDSFRAILTKLLVLDSEIYNLKFTKIKAKTDFYENIFDGTFDVFFNLLIFVDIFKDFYILKIFIHRLNLT